MGDVENQNAVQNAFQVLVGRELRKVAGRGVGIWSELRTFAFMDTK